MKHNLMQIWKNILLPAQLQKQSKEVTVQRTLNDKFLQSSFSFKKSPAVRIVGDCHTFTEINTYNELPHVELTEEESFAVKQVHDEIISKGGYDGDQMLVTDVVYDEEKNTVYLEVKQARYSLLRAIALKKLPEGSNLYDMDFYKTGVMSPYITRDDNTVFVKREADGLYSAASGFLEPKGERKRLNPKTEDLVRYTAKKESVEEFLGDEKYKDLRANFSIAQITGLSFRKTKSGMGTVEFVAPMFVDCRREQLEEIIKNNRAKDSKEHTNEYAVVPLDSSARSQAMEFMASDTPGHFLYCPMLIESARLTNMNTRGDVLPKSVSSSRTSIIPTQYLTPHPHRALTWSEKIKNKMEQSYLKVYEALL